MQNEQQDQRPANAIAIAEAQKRIKDWRELIGSMPSFKGSNADFIPRAMFIPYEDLKEILEKYDKQRKGDPHHKHKYPMGIRVYYSLLVPGHPVIDPPGSTIEMRLTAVAVTHEGKDFPFVDSISGDVDATTYVYDFTSPCPSTCDTTSDLYVE